MTLCAAAQPHVLRSVIAPAIIALGFVLFGHCFVLQRSVDGPTPYQTVGGDTLQYVSMIRGGSEAVRPPFKHRFLVPFIGGLLPVSATDFLRAVSYGSLFVTYFAIQLACRRLRIDLAASTAGLVVLFASSSHLYNFHNPFLLDAFALAILSVMVWSILSGSFATFCLVAVIGVLSRETTIFLVPLWALRDLRRGIILSVLSLALIVGIRFEPSVDFGGTVGTAFEVHAVSTLAHSVLLGRAIFLSWGPAWLMMLAGLCLFSGRDFIYMLTIFLALFCGSVLTSLFAFDTVRMFQILAPVVGVASARVFMTLKEERLYVWIGMLLAVLVVHVVVAIPNAVLGEVLNGAQLLKFSVLVVSLSIILSTVTSLREEIQAAFRQNTKFLAGKLRAWRLQAVFPLAPIDRRSVK